MATSTSKQRQQRTLAWKKFQLLGARGNLYSHEKELPEEVRLQLRELKAMIDETIALVDYYLRNIK